MPFDSTQKPFLKLSRVISAGERRVVPFAGAGLSAYGPKEDRLPLWNQLICQLKERAENYGLMTANEAQLVKDLVDKNEHIAAIDRIINYVGERQFRTFIEDTFNVTDKPIPPALTELVCISWSLIITTNIDNFIENAWRKKHSKPIEVITSKDTLKLAQVIAGADSAGTAKLLKIHGTVEKYETWILTASQYELLLRNNIGYVEALKNLFLQTIFFVGYGLNDGDFQILLSQITAIYPAGIGSYYVLLSDNLKGTTRIKHLMREYGVQPIWYHYYPELINEPHGGHGEVLECLQLLVQAWVKNNRAVPMTLKYFPELEPDFVGRFSELNIIHDHILCESPKSLQIIGFGGEGKTSLVQQFLSLYREQLTISKYDSVFGCSFYRADAGRFINDAYAKLHFHPEAVDIASKVSELIHIFRKRPILLIWDGIEAIQDERGEITNPYLKDLFLAAVKGASTVIVTSRTPVGGANLERLDLGPLSEDDAVNLLQKWGITAPSSRIRHIVREQIGLHALSVRIVAGFVKHYQENAMELLEKLSISSIPDEADTLRTNKAARILEYYDRHLSEELKAFMRCFSIFQRPVGAAVVMTCLTKSLGNKALNSKLVGKDLRPFIRELINRRLLIIESGSLLTTHPLVREYFRKHVDEESTKPLHRELVFYYESILKESSPKTFEQTLPYFDLCYHEAFSDQWTLFHHTFEMIINRKHENYLGYTIGAWEEYLDLALLVFPDRDINQLPQVEPAYYLAATARGLKHLGHSAKSRTQYIKCINLCSETKEFETARYINNLLTLSIAMGHLHTAYLLMPLNIATLKWIRTEWRYRWQMEHAFYSIGYLAGLLGNLKCAEEYCEHAYRVWDGFGEQRKWFYHYHRLYQSDIILAVSDKRQDEALEITCESLSTGEEHGWTETISLAHRCLCSAYRSLYRSDRGTDSHIKMAEEHLAKATKAANEIPAPRLEIEVLMERIRLYVTVFLKENTLPSSKANMYRIIGRIKELVDRCDLNLYQPELKAAQGWFEYFHKRGQEARAYCQSATDAANDMGQKLVIISKNCLIEPLRVVNDMVAISDSSEDNMAFTSVQNLLNLEVTPEELRNTMKTILIS